MRIKKFFVIFPMILLLLWSESITVFAMNTGFSTTELSPEFCESFQNNINLEITMQEPNGDGISCFDISDSEMIALGRDTSLGKYVYIYDSNGIFQYGYSFYDYGRFRVEWDNENIIIHFVRSDLAALIDENGKIIELKKIENTNENNSYWRQLNSPERVVNNNKYTLKCDMGLLNFVALSYSQVVKTDSNGDVTMMYDANTAYLIQTIMALIGIVSFISIVVGTIIHQYLKYQKRDANHIT